MDRYTINYYINYIFIIKNETKPICSCCPFPFCSIIQSCSWRIWYLNQRRFEIKLKISTQSWRFHRLRRWSYERSIKYRVRIKINCKSSTPTLIKRILVKRRCLPRNNSPISNSNPTNSIIQPRCLHSTFIPNQWRRNDCWKSKNLSCWDASINGLSNCSSRCQESRATIPVWSQY